jgi:hypothetical protein
MMAEFSWYTDDKPHISTYLNGAPKKRYLVVDGIAVIGRCVMHYKPNRKGGHTHNHLKNMELRLMLSKKEIKALRKIMKRETKNG